MTDLPSRHIEAIYEALAEAIDRAGPQHESLFLTKLALTLGARLDDPVAFRDSIDLALARLDPPSVP